MNSHDLEKTVAELVIAGKAAQIKDPEDLLAYVADQQKKQDEKRIPLEQKEYDDNLKKLQEASEQEIKLAAQRAKAHEQLENEALDKRLKAIDDELQQLRDKIDQLNKSLLAARESLAKCITAWSDHSKAVTKAEKEVLDAKGGTLVGLDGKPLGDAALAKIAAVRSSSNPVKAMAIALDSLAKSDAKAVRIDPAKSAPLVVQKDSYLCTLLKHAAVAGDSGDGRKILAAMKIATNSAVFKEMDDAKADYEKQNGVDPSRLVANGTRAAINVISLEQQLAAAQRLAKSEEAYRTRTAMREEKSSSIYKTPTPKPPGFS
jgi:hypothetical protein